MESGLAARIVGRWVTDLNDAESVRAFGKVTLEFRCDGSLRYAIHKPDRELVMLLTYRLEGDEIVTDQPSHPCEERSKVRIEGDLRLKVRHAGVWVSYIRVV